MEAETLADRTGVYVAASMAQNGRDVELPSIGAALERLTGILRNPHGGDCEAELIEGILARGGR